MTELDATLGNPDGSPAGVNDDALFEPRRGNVMAHRPSPDPPTRGRVHPVELPAIELAAANHVGAHGDIDVTYGDLGAWAVANAMGVFGLARETYLVGTRDTSDRTLWRTEIGWPVFAVGEPRRS